METFKHLCSMIYDEKLIPFAVGAAITSLLVLFVDYLFFYCHKNRESLLGITYRGNNFFVIALTWFGGGLVVPYLCALFEIFDSSKQAMISLGILWPVAFTKLIEGSKSFLSYEDDVEEDLLEEES